MNRTMKETNIPWIGKIPIDWQICRFKDIAVSKKEIVGEKAEDYVRLALTLNGVIKRGKDDDKGLQPSDFYSYQILNVGDFIFKMIDLQNVSTSRVGLSPFTGIVSPAYVRFVPNNGINQDFYYFYLMSLYYQKVYNNIAGDGVRSALNARDLGLIACPIPPKEEQIKIVKAIKEKEEKINALIANEEEQIEKLKAYKQALISEVVTKGLNPNVPMKDSNQYWFGEVSTEFEILKTLWCLEMPITDGPHETPVLVDDGVPFISAEAVSCGDGGIDFSHMRGYITWDYYEECSKKYIPQKDDIYMIKSGATTGRVSIVDTNEIFTIWSPLAVFRVNKNKVLPKYMYYFLQSSFYQKQVELKWTFGTQQNIGMRTLEQLLILIPSMNKQILLVAYLDHFCNKIKCIIKKKSKKIDALKQYRQSVIYEYVTGKRKVY